MFSTTGKTKDERAGERQAKTKACSGISGHGKRWRSTLHLQAFEASETQQKQVLNNDRA